MQFVINVLPNDHFIKRDVKQFLANVKSQRMPNVKLVFKRCPSLTRGLISYIKRDYPNSLIVSSYQQFYQDSQPLTYWINLHVTDCLLPHAIIQWEQVIKRHSGQIIQIRYLKNNFSLVQQTGRLISRIARRHPVQISTVKRMMGLPVNVMLSQISLSQQLWMLLGLQTYRVLDTTKRYRILKDFGFGANFLFKCTSKRLTTYQKSGVAMLFKVILNEPELVQLNLPTVILSELSFKNRFRWLQQMAYSRRLIGNAHLAKLYRNSLKATTARVKRSIRVAPVNRFRKARLLSRINHFSRK